MLGLAISLDETRKGALVETGTGEEFICSDWPSDSDTRLVKFRPKGRTACVVNPDELAKDIRRAIDLIKKHKVLRKESDWLRRLKQCASGSEADC